MASPCCSLKAAGASTHAEAGAKKVRSGCCIVKQQGSVWLNWGYAILGLN
jgi:hypothetical protein